MTVKSAVEKAREPIDPAAKWAEGVADGTVKMAPILKALGIDPSNPAHQAALLVANKYGLDLTLHHVLVLPQGSAPYITRDGYLHIAHRSGDYDGMEVLEQTETPTHFVAKVAVWRKSMSHPHTFIGKYPKVSKSRADPEIMALKNAVRTALKHAFDVSDDPLLGVHVGDLEVDTPTAIEAVIQDAPDDGWDEGEPTLEASEKP